MKNDPPNKAELTWREIVRSHGCVLDMGNPVQIHHVVGRTAKHNRVDIGHWFILPVSEQAHREIERFPKDEQKLYFRDICTWHQRVFGELPFGADVLLAIWDWHR